jgi:hypothetical protein
MPTISQTVNNIGGLLPTFNNTQSAEPRVIAGRNFRWHYDGPISGWGNSIVSNNLPLNNDLPYYGLFTINDRSILTTCYGIYEKDNNHEWVKVFSLEPNVLNINDMDYPWSEAFVGDSHYFSHPTIGIIAYNVYTCDWKKVKLECCIGEDTKQLENDLKSLAQFYDFSSPDVCKENIVYSITSAGNRLIIQSKDTIGHSEIDNGCNLECDPFCGGGFVSSSMIRYGKPLGVFKTLNGYAAFGSMGVMQARNIESIGAFSYSTVSYNNKPINPWAITSYGTDHEIIFVAKSGIKIASLNRESLIIQEFEKEIGSWLVEKEFPRQNSLLNQHGIALFYSEETMELFISLVPHSDKNNEQNVYTRSLVFNDKYKKWSSFDQWHYIIGPVNTVHDQNYYYTLGFLCNDLFLHWFDYSNCNGFNDNLDSFIEIGTFGIITQSRTNIESTMTDFRIYVEGDSDLLNNELNSQLRTNEFEDNWQTKSVIDFNADVKAHSSLDGYQRLINSEFETVLKPDSIDSSFSKNYSCQTSGLYHSITISAIGVNQTYSLKQVTVQLKTNGTIA